MEVSLKEKVGLLVTWLQEKKAYDVVNVDVSDKCSFTEYIIVCSGTATLHNKAIADFIIEKAQENNFKILGKEGFTAATWILIDMNDVVIHIFVDDVRDMYKLEDLWTKKITVQE